MTACERIRAAREAAEVDFTVRNEGSIVLLTGVSDAAEEWIESYVGGDDTQYWGDAVVVEHRYIVPIIEAMEAQGFTWLER